MELVRKNVLMFVVHKLQNLKRENNITLIINFGHSFVFFNDVPQKYIYFCYRFTICSIFIEDKISTMFCVFKMQWINWSKE